MKKNALKFPHPPVVHEDGVRRSGVCLWCGQTRRAVTWSMPTALSPVLCCCKCIEINQTEEEKGSFYRPLFQTIGLFANCLKAIDSAWGVLTNVPCSNHYLPLCSGQTRSGIISKWHRTRKVCRQRKCLLLCQGCLGMGWSVVPTSDQSPQWWNFSIVLGPRGKCAALLL